MVPAHKIESSEILLRQLISTLAETKLSLFTARRVLAVLEHSSVFILCTNSALMPSHSLVGCVSAALEWSLVSSNSFWLELRTVLARLCETLLQLLETQKQLPQLGGNLTTKKSLMITLFRLRKRRIVGTTFTRALRTTSNLHQRASLSATQKLKKSTIEMK